MIESDGKRILIERGYEALDTEGTGVTIDEKRPGGPVSENMIRPFEISITSKHHDGELTESFWEKSTLPAHVVAGSALTVTPIAAQSLIHGDQSQYQMACKLRDYFQDNQRVLFSFNGINYDLKLLRHFYFENLQYPYQLSQDDRIHVDLLHASYAARDFSDQIQFIINEKGKKSLKQTDIALANGIDVGVAHTAADDTRTLMQIADLFLEKIPEIIFTAVECGNKFRVQNKMIEEEYFCHSNPWSSKALAPLMRNSIKGMENEIYFFDLAHDPEKYINASETEISKLIGKSRSPIVRLALNKNPILLSGTRFSEKIGINTNEALSKAMMISSNEGFINNLNSALIRRGNPYTKDINEKFPEMTIYSGFPPNADYLILNEFSGSSFNEKIQIRDHLKDSRLKAFANRLLVLEHPRDCQKSMLIQYQDFAKKRLLNDGRSVPNLTLPGAIEQMDDSIAKGYDNEDRIDEINQYHEHLRKELES